MAGGLPKGLLLSKKSKKRQKKSRQSAQLNQDGPPSVSNQSDNFSTLGATANPCLPNSLPLMEMAAIFEIVDIKGKGLGCVATTDIKRGSLILNETHQMQFFGGTLNEAIQKGQVAEWINSLLNSFNQMNEADQLEFMTLCNIYDFQDSPLCKKRIIVEMIVGEISPELKMDFELVKTIKSEIDKIEKDAEKAEKILKICNIFASNPYFGFNMTRFNHSCQPNASPIMMASGQNQIRAIKDIKQGEEINISYLGPFDILRNTRYRQNHLFYAWHFLCLCDLCKNNELDTDEAYESLVQEAEKNAKNYSAFLSKQDPSLCYPLETCRRAVECFKEIYLIGIFLKGQNIAMLTTVEKGFQAALTGYMFHKLPQFKCDAENFAKAAENFENKMGFQPNLWKEKCQNFDMWFEGLIYHLEINATISCAATQK